MLFLFQFISILFCFAAFLPKHVKTIQNLMLRVAFEFFADVFVWTLLAVSVKRLKSHLLSRHFCGPSDHRNWIELDAMALGGPTML
jgi:hypothetical protein